MRIYFIAALIAIFFLWREYKKAPDDATRRKLLQRNIVYGLIAVIFVLAATGRIHWLGAIFAALFPILKVAFTALLRFFPALASIYAKRQQNSQAPQAPATTSAIGLSEAREILGVPEHASEEEIQLAYKKQIQKVHPDKGGSEYFATKLNEARDLLLKELS